MKLAISAVEKKKMSIRKAAAALGVPKDSLNRRVNGRMKNVLIDERHKNVLGRYLAVLTRNVVMLLQIV